MESDLKVNLPGGKRIRVRDKWTDKVQYKKAYILYPNKPCNVPNEDAERLLEQDPHLVSTKPYGTDKDESLKIEIQHSAQDEKLRIVHKLAEIDFSSLNAGEIISYGKELGIDIPMSVKREIKEKMLESRCKELAKELNS